MEQLIEEELGGRTPDEVEELNIDNCKATHIAGLTDKFVNLQTLSMANSELSSLKGFPSLPNLRKLDLSDNRISGGFDVLTGSPNLEYIGLSGNPIKEVSVLEPLKKLTHLHSLEVFNCDIANNDGYREKIFELLENVIYVDGMDRSGQTAPEEDYDGEEDDEDGASNEEDDDEDSEDGVPGEDEGSDDDEGSDEDDDEPRGTKRKHEDEENADDA